MSDRIKHGIYLPNFGPYGDAHTLVCLAQDAEEAGWDGFFLWDHIAGWSLPMVDDWVALAAVAAHTTTIRLGTTVTPIPRRRPWKLARETVSLDCLSGGRLILGVGSGEGAGEGEDLGDEPDPRRRGAMLDEGLDVLEGLWRGELFNYQGQFYHIKDALFLPRTLQQPRIPIWVGGFWPHKAPFRRAARWDGVFPLFQVDSESEELRQLREVIAFVQEQRTVEKPPDIISLGMTPGDRLDEAAEGVWKRAALGATWWLELIAPFRFGKGFTDNWPLEAMRERILQGPPMMR